MNDYYNNPKQVNNSYLDTILDHIITISKGKCNISDEMIISSKNEKFESILYGLQILYEDLDLYKKEIAQKLEAEYQVEILKKKNEELTQFNYIASHDLQEPLRTIKSFSSILQNDYADQLDDDAQTYLNFIQNSSTRMSDLIFDLLNYSKVGGNYTFKNVDSNKIINIVIDDLHHTLASLDPIVSINNLPIIYCNQIAIQQVFQNLISNALKFRKPDQKTELTISATSDEHNNIFCVSDNGLGIDSKYKDKIFGIFQRLHTKDEYEGTGIGLALCKKVIDLHQGKIWFQSELEVGTQFYFTIPKH